MRCAKCAGNVGIELVTWDNVPKRCWIRLLVIAIATAVCLVGIRVGANDWQGLDGAGRNSVALSSPATHAPPPVRVARIKDGAGNFVPDALPIGCRVSFGVAEGSPRAFWPEPPNAFRNALRTLPLPSRPPPLA